MASNPADPPKPMISGNSSGQCNGRTASAREPRSHPSTTARAWAAASEPVPSSVPSSEAVTMSPATLSSRFR
ncbi:hypothetical protein [Streptomyces lydicus]|uniref:hypothetical protein n=1 Tax=Streptomyces lydicus TaxID=47763 RepID=UPI0013E3624A|nr:hypothetical protein [Streptomyces lydicus]